jgi:Concanavalin A-like lectin/glucanases superfamily
MSDGLILAAPLLIGAIVLAVAFVGCEFQPGIAAATYHNDVSNNPHVVSYWRLSDAAGAAAVDSKGNNDGAYNGNVTHQVDGLLHSDPDRAASFDGANAYVSVPHKDTLNPAKFTVEALMQPSAIGDGGPNDYHAIVSSRDIDQATNDVFGYILYLHGTQVEAWVGTGAAMFSQAMIVTAKVTAGGGPYYVAMTCDGGTLALYVNPINPPNQPAPDQVASGPVAYQPNTKQELRIGAGANEQAATYFFPGVIDEVAVYNDVLDYATIQQHLFAMMVQGM